MSILNALAFAVPAIAAGTGAERLIGWLMLPVLVGIGFVLAAIGRDLIMRATHITPSGPDDVARTRAEVPNYALLVASTAGLSIVMSAIGVTYAVTGRTPLQAAPFVGVAILGALLLSLLAQYDTPAPSGAEH